MSDETDHLCGADQNRPRALHRDLLAGTAALTGPAGDGTLAIELKDDLLRGAAEIAEFILGDRGQVRTIYHWVGTSRIPTFRLGTMICARRAVLLRWIAEQEGCLPSTVGGHHRRKDKPE